jgi:hypothetical protein
LTIAFGVDSAGSNSFIEVRNPTPTRGFKARWRFFRLRYRANLENPTPRSPEQRLGKASVGIAAALVIAVISLAVAIVDGTTSGWLGAAAMLILAAYNGGELRRARRDRDSQHLSR